MAVLFILQKGSDRHYEVTILILNLCLRLYQHTNIHIQYPSQHMDFYTTRRNSTTKFELSEFIVVNIISRLRQLRLEQLQTESFFALTLFQ